MPDKILLTTAGSSFLFLVSGAVMLGFSLIVKNSMNEEPEDGTQAARNLLYQQFPLEAGIANAVMVFLTFGLLLPGMIMPTRRVLKYGSFAIVVCLLFTLCIGVYLWVLTLRTKDEFFELWKEQEQGVQNLMQTSFQCCGYINSTTPAFVTNDICMSPAAAALMRGCSAPISSFVNIFVNDIFTAVFAVVGVDAIVILAIACLLKERKERERYRHIDEKYDYRTL